MSAYNRLKQKSATFRQLTGLSLAEFDKLLAELEVARQARREQQQQRRPRRRRPGGGRRPKLALADQLLVVLIYYRTYITQDFLGFLFQIVPNLIPPNRARGGLQSISGSGYVYSYNKATGLIQIFTGAAAQSH